MFLCTLNRLWTSSNIRVMIQLGGSASQSKLVEMFMVLKRVCLAHLMSA